jgi:hypothetical protein
LRVIRGPVAAMSGNSLGRWPEPDHFVFKVLPCPVPGANESKIVICSPIKESQLGPLASAAAQI